MDDATLKDLGFKFRSSREVHGVDRRVCLSGASYAAAEKSGILVALRIFWERNHTQIFLFNNHGFKDASNGQSS
jgi:hypothetical protein